MNKKKPIKPSSKRKVLIKKAKISKSHPKFNLLKFLPAILFLGLALYIQVPFKSHLKHNSKTSVLSFATAMSSSELFTQTNIQRTNNGVANLAFNNQLTSAAQTKANDMVARNYWSHTTPTGEEPWVFISNAGYQYQTAGENLAYGFANSSDTITGWMNSPPHRDNLLNSAFNDVGFGFANSENFVNDGQQTVVVAMYGAPLNQTAAAPTSTVPVQNTPTTPNTTQVPQQTSVVATNNAPVTEAIQTTTVPAKAESITQTAVIPTQALTAEKSSKSAVPSAKAASVRRIQVLTGGNARWSSSLLVFSIVGVGLFWTLERGRQFKQLALAGEHYILKHLHIDIAVVSFIFLGFTLLQTSGLVR